MSVQVWGGYPRISEDPKDTRAGITRQREDISETVTRLGGNAATIAWYPENDTSAFKKRRIKVTDPLGNEYVGYRVIRPVWHRALNDLRTGVITALAVWDLDRLARDPRDLEDAIEAVEYYGATIVSATASTIDLNTDSGRAMARVMVAMGNKQSADTARRVRRAHEASARAGTPVGGTRPYGFEWDRVTHNQHEVEIIHRAAQAALDGVSLHVVARELADAGEVSPGNVPWKAATLKKMLLGPRLAGWRVHRGIVATNADGSPVRGQWEPILDQDTFDRLNVVLTREDTRRRKPRKGSRHYLLTGTARCGICNGPMYGNAAQKGAGLFYYQCKGSMTDRHSVAVSGSGVDEAVSALVLRRLEREELARPTATFDAEAELERTKEQITELMTAFRENRLSAAITFPQVEQLEARRDELEAQRASFIDATAGPEIRPLSAAEWAAMDTDRQRAIVERNLSAVLIKPATKGGNRLDLSRVVPVWRTP